MASTKNKRVPRWYVALVAMNEAEKREDYDSAELVREGRECWLGLRRFPATVVDQLNLRMAISHQGQFGQEKLERYRINETGRKLLASDEAF